MAGRSADFLDSLSRQEDRFLMEGKDLSRRLGTLAILFVVFLVALTVVPSAWAARKYKTLYKFAPYPTDGQLPFAGLIFDKDGNLYGTTFQGGAYDYGTVFKLTPNSDGSWAESVLHSFNADDEDGGVPFASVIFDPAGNLYGTTGYGGAYNYGTVFKLTPNKDGRWAERVIHSFNGNDGRTPRGGLIFDAAGNLYGTTATGGSGCNGNGCGTIFKLMPNEHGSWTESVLHRFNITDGYTPVAGLTFDAAGNLYGTTQDAGPYDSFGTVFKLTPGSDGSWTEKVLYQFRGGSDGSFPSANIIFDKTGNLYSTTWAGGADSWGTVFKLTPSKKRGWTESVLHSFTNDGKDGLEPYLGGVIFDPVGNLYGTTEIGGVYRNGTVFKLAPTGEETVLHSFKDHPGAWPVSGIIFDERGNLYGTTLGDNSKTHGSVFEITQ
jgi:uncharacterized repeat protein (TIGR03803 family)